MAEQHESTTRLSPATQEMHRALASLIEELEAVDWYAQRIDASEDAELRAVLAHNRDEEKEHACMMLEWIRRRDPAFDEYLRRYLFRSDAVTDEQGSENDRADRTLRIGSLRAKEARSA
jgi:hypothetical protein